MAAHNALAELIERDAFLIHWLNRVTPPRMDLAHFPNSEVQRLLAECRLHRIDLTVFDITSDFGIPTFLAIVRSIGPGYPVYASTRADYDSDRAIAHLIIDALKVGMFTPLTESEVATAARHDFPVRTIRQRRAFWSNPRNATGADFLFGGPTRTPPRNEHSRADHREKFNCMVSALKSAGIATYLIDVTSAFARREGLHVLRAIAPGLCPLYLDERYRCAGISRLYRAPQLLGYAGARNEAELNPIPHPLL
jgi:ribosomal protein S12 methylthiotransferase accessory factor